MSRHPFLSYLAKTGMNRVVWGTDADLTLLDPHDDPHRPPREPRIASACEKLDEMTDGRLYIITGRDMKSIDSILAPSKFKISCEYHNHVRFDLNLPPEERVPVPAWPLVQDGLESVLARNPGMVMREKHFMRTLYHNDTLLRDPAARAAVGAELDGYLEMIRDATGQKLVNTDGGRVYDLGPAGSDKGTAYAEVLAHAQRNYKGEQPLVPLYFGDSPGDIPGAKFVKANGGVFGAVGKDPRVLHYADFVFESPAEMRAVIYEATGLAPSMPPPRPSAGPRAPGNH